MAHNNHNSKATMGYHDLIMASLWPHCGLIMAASSWPNESQSISMTTTTPISTTATDDDKNSNHPQSNELLGRLTKHHHCHKQQQHLRKLGICYTT
jgi:hypothetical protein